MENELEIIAERATCDGKNCGKPNLLWQPWRNLFRCGWCGKDYQITEALNLPRLTGDQYKDVMSLRADVISGASKLGFSRTHKKGGE